MRTTRLGGLALLATLALALAACGGSGYKAPAQGAGSQPAATSAQPAATGVALGSSQLGQILTDAKGRALYAFTPDTGGTSTCYGGCATSWPPLLATASPAGGPGVTASLLGTTKRTDGHMQVTYKSRPLYYYAADQKAGDLNGQGILGKWFVVGADGALVTKAAGSSSGGYGTGSYKG